MPAPMHADRRNVLTASAAGAVMAGLFGKAGAHGVAPPTSSPSRPPSVGDQIASKAPPNVPAKHAYVDNVVMIAELTIKAGMIEAFIDYTVANLAISRSYPGNISFDILIDEGHPNKVTFYEVWKSPSVQREYMAWRVKAGDLTKLLSFLEGEPKFTAFRSIAA